MKFLIVVLAMFAMVAAYPERERRSVWGWPAVAPAAAVIGPKAIPAAVIGPNAGAAVVSAAAPAVIAAHVPAAAVVAPGAVVAPHIW
ncbi:uncharacterized protein LOC118449440 [Vespa mandarinia]|uniref:uncharacterized protein LOC118449440 n=1 Tax=Vespa mandarinia TaxID=7446 RepID=UPI00160C7F2E|nr:uncharacterized protein LOC118449440 [Vespa mandarinia]XP_046824408.1 uncharacterized protein LOC124426594 [Vespa crabro]XP_047357167.1 uncharacterized protein LOC124952000 [Vespa velutina]